MLSFIRRKQKRQHESDVIQICFLLLLFFIQLLKLELNTPELHLAEPFQDFGPQSAEQGHAGCHDHDRVRRVQPTLSGELAAQNSGDIEQYECRYCDKKKAAERASISIFQYTCWRSEGGS